MNKMQALQELWSEFSWTAYDVNTVPEDADVDNGYITYEAVSDEFGNTLTRNVNLWHRSSSWHTITLKEMEISAFIGKGGILRTYDGGAFWVRKGSPWAQRMDEPSDDTIRRIILNYDIEFID